MAEFNVGKKQCILLYLHWVKRALVEFPLVAEFVSCHALHLSEFSEVKWISGGAAKKAELTQISDPESHFLHHSSSPQLPFIIAIRVSLEELLPFSSNKPLTPLPWWPFIQDVNNGW